MSFISAEDLIVHKCLAGRPRDIEDVERILVRQGLDLDMNYVRGWLDAFAPAIEDHDVLAAFENALYRARKAAGDSDR
jgi:hypothetical protein